MKTIVSVIYASGVCCDIEMQEFQSDFTTDVGYSDLIVRRTASSPQTDRIRYREHGDEYSIDSAVREVLRRADDEGGIARVDWLDSEYIDERLFAGPGVDLSAREIRALGDA